MATTPLVPEYIEKFRIFRTILWVSLREKMRLREALATTRCSGAGGGASHQPYTAKNSQVVSYKHSVFSALFVGS